MTESNILGYKMREHIAKGLKRRSATVEAAVKKYNDAAKKLEPPRPRINTKTVLDFAAVAEFDLLRQTRHNVTEKPWSRQAERDAMTMYFKLQRSREEIRRLDIEIKRLSKYMDSYDSLFSTLSTSLDAINPAMAFQLRKWDTMRGQVDAIHRLRIQAIQKLSGYTGEHIINTSQQIDSAPSVVDGQKVSGSVKKAEHGDIDEDDDVDSDDEYAMFDEVLQAISSITID